MEFSRQEYWSGLPFPSPADLPDPGIEPGSPASQVEALKEHPRSWNLPSPGHTHWSHPPSHWSYPPGHTHPVPATPIAPATPTGHTHQSLVTSTWPHPPNPGAHPPGLWLHPLAIPTQSLVTSTRPHPPCPQSHPCRWALWDQLPWDAVLQALVSYHPQNLGFLLTASPSHAISSGDCIWPLWTQSQIQGNCLWHLPPLDTSHL